MRKEYEGKIINDWKEISSIINLYADVNGEYKNNGAAIKFHGGCVRKHENVIIFAIKFRITLVNRRTCASTSLIQTYQTLNSEKNRFDDPQNTKIISTSTTLTVLFNQFRIFYFISNSLKFMKEI